MNEIFDKFDINVFLDGLVVSGLGYAVVFIALVFLYGFITFFTRFLSKKQRSKLRKEGHVAAENPDLSVSGEVSAAIASAIYLHFAESHDIENTVLTIKKIQRPYSPWSSKLYGLREVPKIPRINNK